MQLSPLLFGVVSFLDFVLIIQNDLLEFLRFQTLD